MNLDLRRYIMMHLLYTSTVRKGIMIIVTISIIRKTLRQKSLAILTDSEDKAIPGLHLRTSSIIFSL